MEQVINLVEVRSCYKCRVETKLNLKYCKKCTFSSNFTTQFYSYDFKKSKNSKKPLKVAIKFPSKPQLTKELDIVYYINPLEKSVFTNLKLTRFKNLTHLTNYILYSNQLPNTQLIYHLAPELKSFPQIKQILHSNEKFIGQYISSISIPNNRDSKNCVCSNSLSLINDPNFWIELIKLYIQFCLPSESTFNIKNFDPKKLSQQLLIAIYYSGYQHRSQKSPELTQYMDQLFRVNLKKVLFTPSLQNIQALYIYCQVLFDNGEISLTRTCFAALSRMLYSLGIQIDSDRFDPNTNFNRKLILRRVSIFDSSLVGVFKYYSNYITELPKFWESLYDVYWYLTPSKWSKFEEKSIEKYLEASITVINNKFYDRTCIIMDFEISPSAKALSNDKLFKTKLKSLNSAYSEVLKLNQNLKWSYPQQVEKTENFELSIKVSYFHLSLVLLEYWKLNEPGKNSELTQKTLEFSTNLFELISESEEYKYQVFYCYLIGFTLLSNMKDFDKVEKSKVLNILKKLKVIVEEKHNEFNNLNFLLFDTGLKHLI